MTPKPSNAKHAATYRAKQAARVKAMREALEAIIDLRNHAKAAHFGQPDNWAHTMAVIAESALAPQGEK